MSEALTIQGLSDALADVFLISQADKSRAFINSKVMTVYQHVASYPPPDPNDPHDVSKNKNIYNRMKDQLKQARHNLKRLGGDKQKKAFEDVIRRAEQALENWWAGGPI